MSKKILSIALAVVMLFSVLACTVGAANTTVTTTFPTDGQCGFRLVTDAYVGQPAGEEVTLKVYWVLPVGTDYSSYLQNLGNVIVAFTDGFSYNTASPDTATAYDGRTWGSAYADYIKEASGLNAKTSYSTTIINALSAEDQAYGWDTAMLVQCNINTSNTTTNAGWNVDPDCEFFTLSFTTTREITADDSFGIPSHNVGSVTKASSTTGSKTTYYTAANTIISEAYCPANVVTVSETATAKMRPGTEAGTVDLGITGAVNALSFTAGKEWGAGCYVAPNLANIGVQARVNGVVSAAESTCIYETDNGFKYRAAITGIDADGLGAQIEVRTYITDVNGNTYFSNWMYIDAADVHTAAVGNGMTGIA